MKRRSLLCQTRKDKRTYSRVCFAYALAIILIVCVQVHLEYFKFSPSKILNKDDQTSSGEVPWVTLEEIIRNDTVKRSQSLSSQHLDFDADKRISYTNQISRNMNEQNFEVNIELFNKMQDINREEKIWNTNIFGTNFGNETLFIIIQVHDRLELLQELVQSMASSSDINSTIVIFSHDIYHAGMNSFISNITAFRYMQLFFPYNNQVYVDKFPGKDKRDCIGREKCDKNSRNLNWKDSFGNHRDPKFVQIKHHWWWKINKIFDDMILTKHFDGGILFLEEDQYVSKDFIHIYNLIKQRKNEICPHCNVINLGTHYTPKKLQPNSIGTVQWTLDKFNIGFVLFRIVWKILSRCKKEFCNYDDYNWDLTLTHMREKCGSDQIFTLVVYPTRIFHTGICSGIHSKTANCNINKTLNVVKRKLRNMKSDMFPQKFNKVGILQPSKKKKSKPNGGWGDPRDKKLCMHILNGTVDTDISD